MLQALGFSDLAERIYRALLVDGARTTGELAADLAVTPADIGPALHELRAAGCVLRTTADRYTALPPDVAFEPLIAREQDAAAARAASLRRLGDSLATMTRTYLLGAAGTNLDVLEVVAPDQVGERFDLLQRLARREVLGFDKPPYATDITDNTVQLGRLSSGVVYKTVYDRAAFDVDGNVESIDAVVAAGELARVAMRVPMKLVLVDRRMAMIPLHLGGSELGSGLLVHSSPLLDALVVLFEAVWERAEPLGAPGADGPAFDPVDRQILALLRTGLTDESIASRLHIGRRTVTRRVAAMASRLGARTRFQAGMRAEREGWFVNTDDDIVGRDGN